MKCFELRGENPRSPLSSRKTSTLPYNSLGENHDEPSRFLLRAASVHGQKHKNVQPLAGLLPVHLMAHHDQPGLTCVFLIDAVGDKPFAPM